MATITTTLGDRDTATLKKTTGRVDNDNETMTWVEYCLPDCAGPAHRTGNKDAPHVFCAQHIHRSAHIDLKHGVFGAGEVGGVT